MSLEAPEPAELLPIRTVATLTGVNPITLRAWERRYGLIRPLRTKTGHRLYTHQHVERVRRALALIERGIQISRVNELLGAEPEANAGAAPQPRNPWPPYLERLAAAVASFDQPELDRVYEELLSIYSIDQVTRELLLPSLARLGERWDKLSGGIAEEHFLTTYIRSKLGARLQHRSRYAAGARILATCAPGEPHELGLLLFALEAQEAGLQPIILAGSTPFTELAAAYRRARCAAIVVSCTVAPDADLLEHQLPQLVRSVDVPVFLGGAAVTRARSAINVAGARSLGAETHAGVRLLLSALHLRSKARPR